MVKKITITASILLFFTTIALWLILPAETTLNWSITILLLLSVVLSINFFKSSIVNSFSPSFLNKLPGEILTIVLTISIITLSAYLANNLHWQKDISLYNSNTLSDKTVKIAKEINAPLKIQFFTRREFWKNWKPFFHLFKIENTQIEYEFINIESNQALIASEEIGKENTAIITYQGKKVKTVLTDELSISNALLKILDQKSEKFLFLQGQGQLSLEDKEKNGLTYFQEVLQKSGHTAESIKLSENLTIDNNSILVIPFLKNPLLKEELETLLKFINSGGRFLIFQGVSFNDKGYESLNELLKNLGVQIENKMTIDRLASVKGSDASLPVIDKFSKTNLITKDFTDRLFFPLSSSIKILDSKLVTAIASTAAFPASWAESELSAVMNGKAKFDIKDTSGPIHLAATVNKSGAKGAIIASHFFITNQYKNHSPQFNFVLNIVDWITGQEKMASLNRPTLKLSRITIGELHLNTIFYGAVIFGPLFLLLTSVGLFWRRKSL